MESITTRITNQFKPNIQRTKKTFNNNKNLFFFFGLVLIILLFFLLEFTFHKRTEHKLNNYKLDTLNKNKKFEPLLSCHKIKFDKKVEDTPRLCDYFVLSSYNSLLVGNQKRDYLSINMLKKILHTGARYIQFEINASNLTEFPIPVVGTGELKGNWAYSLNTIDFVDVLKVIKTNTFIKGMNHPLFVDLKFNSIKKTIINQVGEKIKLILKDKLLDNSKYKYSPLSREQMCNLHNKIIFFSSLNDDDIQNTEFKDVVTFKKYGFPVHIV